MANEGPASIQIHNVISATFLQTHVDGAFGGITPRGLVNLNFFAERFPIPKSSEFELIGSKRIGGLISNSPESKEGIVREFHFGVYMTVETAKSLMQLLDKQIKDFEKKESENDGSKIKKNG